MVLFDYGKLSDSLIGGVEMEAKEFDFNQLVDFWSSFERNDFSTLFSVMQQVIVKRCKEVTDQLVFLKYTALQRVEDLCLIYTGEHRPSSLRDSIDKMYQSYCEEFSGYEKSMKKLFHQISVKTQEEISINYPFCPEIEEIQSLYVLLNEKVYYVQKELDKMIATLQHNFFQVNLAVEKFMLMTGKLNIPQRIKVKGSSTVLLSTVLKKDPPLYDNPGCFYEELLIYSYEMDEPYPVFAILTTNMPLYQSNHRAELHQIVVEIHNFYGREFFNVTDFMQYFCAALQNRMKHLKTDLIMSMSREKTMWKITLTTKG